LNNPLKFTDPSGDKWKWQWLNPFFHFQNFMQWVNDKTPKLRQKMANAGIPDFSVGGSINGNGNVYFSGNYAGQEVFNTQKIDRSNAVQVVSREIAQVNYVDGAAWHASGGGGNSLYAIGMVLNAAGFVSSAGEYSNVINGSWRGVNGNWNSLEWGGNQWTGARANALSKAGYFKVASRGFFYTGAFISGYQGFSAYQKGDYGGVAKSGLDIGMGAFATFGGPPGWIIGGGYFGLDALGAFDRPVIARPYSPYYYALPDNTYVAPPIIKYPR
jgi:hypothetical protein